MINRKHTRPPWYAVAATGYGRSDWAVQGDCRCDDEYCDGSCNVPVAGGLTEAEATQIVGMSTFGEVKRFVLSLGDRFYEDFDGRLGCDLELFPEAQAVASA